VIRAGRVVARVGLWLFPAGVAAQATPGAGVAAVVVASDPWFGGGGVQGVAPIGGLLRLGGLAALGRRGSSTEARGELTLQLAFDQELRTRRLGWYLGAGLAGRTGRDAEGFVLAVVGVEGRAGDRGRWWIESGVGGGARVAVGYRWHRSATKSGRPPR
jgi:hypothetical protein